MVVIVKICIIGTTNHVVSNLFAWNGRLTISTSTTIAGEEIFVQILVFIAGTITDHLAAIVV